MSSEDWFTIIWGTCAVLIGVVGGYFFFYKPAKRAEQHRKTLENKENK